MGAIDFDMSGTGHYLLDLAVATGVIHLFGPKGSRGTQHSPGALRGHYSKATRASGACPKTTTGTSRPSARCEG